MQAVSLPLNRLADDEGIDVDKPAYGEGFLEVGNEGCGVITEDENLEAVATSETCDGGWSGTGDDDVGVGGRAGADFAGETVRLFSDVWEAGVTKLEADEAGVGRVAVFSTPTKFVFEEVVWVLGGSSEDGGVIWLERLDNDAAIAFGSTGSASDLDEELEGTLASPEITFAKRVIGEDYADEGDVRKVEAFGDHLGADEDIGFVVDELMEFGLMVIDGAGGIAVPADDAGGGEVAPHFSFDLLGAGADGAERLAAA
jgi:hypothetical protein